MSVIERGSRGAVAGGVATVAMSALMLAAGRVGLLGRQPPQAIAERAVEVGTGERVPAPAGRALGVLTHLAFGGGAGVGYALLPPAEKDRRDRVAVMVLAHLVYGTVLAKTEQALRAQPDRRTGISRYR
jgi:hypothetical protein